MKFPEHPIAFGTQHHEEKSIFVDKRGNRFTNERFKMHAFGYDELAGTIAMRCVIQSALLLDLLTKREGNLVPLRAPTAPAIRREGSRDRFTTSGAEDNSAEIDRGWIWKANTIEELGRILAAGFRTTPA